MKKIVIAFLVLCFIFLASVYIVIPARIEFRSIILININQTVANRYIANDGIWSKWWPKEEAVNPKADKLATSSFFYKNYSIEVILKMIEGDSIIISDNTVSVYSLLNIIPINSDSVAVQWKGQSTPTFNPLKRLSNYFNEKKVENITEDLLQKMKIFLENREAIYGLHIDQIQVADTLLISTKHNFPSNPTTAEIYSLISSLKNYISTQGALESNYPMLNVTQDSSVFRTMVAIPVNKVIPETSTFLFKRMVPGKILITEVKGGEYTNNHALKQIELYMNDFHLVPPAIPFQSLVTDRSKEPDTTKWVTKIYYPVM